MSKETIAQPRPDKQPQIPNPVLKGASDESRPSAKEGPLPPKVEVKKVKHVFTAEERHKFGDELANAVASHRSIQGELDQVKANYKAKITESESRIDLLSTNLCGGFEMRDKRCIVLFFPKEKRKRYWLEGQDPTKTPFTMDEEMTKDDFQQDLLQVESNFSKRSEIVLFPQAGSDMGLLLVGELGGKWFTALRVKFGRDSIEERLNPEAASTKHRFDAIKSGAKRFTAWLVEKLGKDKAKGFEDPLDRAVQAQKERVE